MKERSKVPSRKPLRMMERREPSQTELRVGPTSIPSGVSTGSFSGGAERMGSLPAAKVVAYSKRTSLQGVDFSQKQAVALLQIRLDTSPQILPQIGEFTSVYTRYRFHPRTAEKIALASYELVENAISYGSISGDIVYTLSEWGGYLEVSVANDSSLGRLSNLRLRLDRIREDPAQAFQEQMSRSVTGTGGRAALGLARICHEAQMDLELEVDGYRVIMRARCSK